MLAGLLEASAEGMDAFRVRDGFNVLYHALAQGDDALQQVRNEANCPLIFVEDRLLRENTGCRPSGV